MNHQNIKAFLLIELSIAILIISVSIYVINVQYHSLLKHVTKSKSLQKANELYCGPIKKVHDAATL